MVGLAVLLFKKNVLGLKFHEIAGIVFCAIIIFHLLLNRKWIAAVSKGLFKKGIPVKTKISYWVDLLLLLDFIALLVSGIGINKTLSPTLAFLPFEAVPWHFLFGAVALVLLGIHFGLHWNWIKGTVLGRAKGKVPSVLKIILTVVLAGIMAFGVCSVTKSALVKWFTTVSVMTQQKKMQESGENVLEEEHSDEEEGTGRQDGSGRFKNGGGKGKGKGLNRNMKPLAAKDIFNYAVSMLSIFVLFASLTAIIEKLVVKVCSRKRLVEENTAEEN